MKAYSWLITAFVASIFHTSVSADNFTNGDFCTHTSAWRSITNGAYDSSPDEHCLDDKSVFLEQTSSQDTSSLVTNAARHTAKKILPRAMRLQVCRSSFTLKTLQNQEH